MALRGKLRTVEGDCLSFWCPGCGMAHGIAYGSGIGPRWTFDGNFDAPTFSPSVLVTWSEPSDIEDEFDDRSKDVPHVCHTFVKNGTIEFLNDCTHVLVGKTVALPDWPIPKDV